MTHSKSALVQRKTPDVTVSFNKVVVLKSIGVLYEVLWWEVCNAVLASALGIMWKVVGFLWIGTRHGNLILAVRVALRKVHPIPDLLFIDTKAPGLHKEILESLGVDFPTLQLICVW